MHFFNSLTASEDTEATLTQTPKHHSYKKKQYHIYAAPNKPRLPSGPSNGCTACTHIPTGRTSIQNSATGQIHHQLNMSADEATASSERHPSRGRSTCTFNTQHPRARAVCNYGGEHRFAIPTSPATDSPSRRAPCRRLLSACTAACRLDGSQRSVFLQEVRTALAVVRPCRNGGWVTAEWSFKGARSSADITANALRAHGSCT